MARIVVVGSSNTDMVVKSSRLPGPGETILGGDFLMAAGGKGANQAVAARRAGADVTLVAAVGDDVFGKGSVQGLRSEGIDVSHVVTLPREASGVALILLDESGENTIVVAPGANMKLTPRHVDAAAEAVRGADVVLLGLEVPVETVCRAGEIASRAGVRVILNPAPAPDEPVPAELMAGAAVLTPNEHEFKALAGVEAGPDDDWAPVRGLLGEGGGGGGAVLMTLGSKGAVLATADSAVHVEPFDVEAIDTVGAGDAFNGALATGLAEGIDLAEAARFAAAAGALATTKMGAQPSMPTRAEIEAILGP